MRVLKKFLGLCLVVLLPIVALAVDYSADDAEITVSPVVRQYPVTQLSTTSAPATFTVTNHDATNILNLLTLSLAGEDADGIGPLKAEFCDKVQYGHLPLFHYELDFYSGGAGIIPSDLESYNLHPGMVRSYLYSGQFQRKQISGFSSILFYG